MHGSTYPHAVAVGCRLSKPRRLHNTRDEGYFGHFCALWQCIKKCEIQGVGHVAECVCQMSCGLAEGPFTSCGQAACCHRIDMWAHDHRIDGPASGKIVLAQQLRYQAIQHAVRATRSTAARSVRSQEAARSESEDGGGRRSESTMGKKKTPQQERA